LRTCSSPRYVSAHSRSVTPYARSNAGLSICPAKSRVLITASWSLAYPRLREPTFQRLNFPIPGELSEAPSHRLTRGTRHSSYPSVWSVPFCHPLFSPLVLISGRGVGCVWRRQFRCQMSPASRIISSSPSEADLRSSTESPTQPGVYWFQPETMPREFMVEVRMTNGELTVWWPN
jgi:hypothetical protein